MPHTQSRQETVYNEVENLAISVDTPMPKARVHMNKGQAPQYDDPNGYDTLVLSPVNQVQRTPAKRSTFYRIMQSFGALLSAGWIVLCMMYMAQTGGTWQAQTPYELGIFLAGMIAPVAFFWMILSYMQRNNDVRYYAESLRAEMHSLFFPSEEESKHVNKDIERMTLQAAELAASSKAAMKSIQRARQGLREEIKVFAALADKTDKAAKGLANTLVDRGETLKDVTSSIEDSVDLIETKSQKAILSWDSASGRMIDRASEIETSMEKSAQTLLESAEVSHEKSQAVADIFDGTITSLGLTVDAVTDRLGHINDSLGSHVTQLTRSGEDLARESGRIGESIQDFADQIQDSAGQSIEKISQSLLDVQDHKTELESAAIGLSNEADKLGESLSGSIDRLEETAAIITDKSESIETRIVEKSNAMAESLDGLDDQINRIDSVSEQASHRLAEGIETALNGANLIGDASRRAVETLTRVSNETSKEAASLITETVSKTNELRQVGATHQDTLSRAVDSLEKCRQEIDKASSTAETHVTFLTQAVDSQSKKLNDSAQILTDQVKTVSRSLEEPLRLVGVAIADADGRHEQIRSTLDRRISDLQEASDSALANVDVIRQSLREQTSDITAISHDLSVQAKTWDENLNIHRNNLSETVSRGALEVKNLVDVIHLADEALDQKTQNILDTISEASHQADSAFYRLEDSSQISLQSTNKLSVQLVEQTNSLENQTTDFINHLNNASETIDSTAQKIEPLYNKIIQGSESAVENLENVKDQYAQTAQTTMEDMQSVGVVFDERLLKLTSTTDSAMEALETSGNTLRDRLADIENAASIADTRMRSIAQALEGQSSDVHILTDQTSMKIEHIQKLINEQFQDLALGVDKAISDIEEAGDRFDKRAEKINHESEIIADGFGKAGDSAKDMQNDLYDLIKLSGQSTAALIEQMETLKETSDSSLENINKTADSLSIKSREIDVTVDNVVGQMHQYGQNIRQYVSDIAAQGDESATTINTALANLISTMGEVNGKTHDVANVIQDVGQSLSVQSGRFVTAVAKSAQAAEQATNLFGDQADNLFKAAELASEKVTEIKETENHAQRETFLSSARFVMESLHSLSIDFTRMMNGSIADKDWKQYQKGNINIFTMQIASTLDSLPFERLQSKYAEDTEFRNHVQKYLRQFEDIMHQAKSLDRGSILINSFMTSDVGHIYAYLCDISGKDCEFLTENPKKAA